MEKNILVLVFIAIMLIGVFLYTDIFNSLYNNQIHPLITEIGNRMNKPTKHIEKQLIWTYLEEPETLDKDINIQLLNKNKNFPILFNFCLQIMNNKINKKYNAFHVVTPDNIKEYLPEFPIEMNAESRYPLKFRTDLVGAMLLSKYGGLFLSPATLVMKSMDEIMYKLKFNYDLITFGGSERVINSCNNKYNPGNYVISAKKDNPVITLYKDKMLDNLKKDNFINSTTGEDLLSNVLTDLKPNNHFHFDCTHTGNVDIRNNMIKTKQFYGYEPLEFKDKDNIIFITLPYDIILENIEYQWFNNLSEDQFFNSNIQLTKLVLDEARKIKK
uniref:Uncharacterized protein n=1 Tax=viral metagenome TaxID=1070528 RepID=A0A6C0C4X9_9ZZZZ